MNYQFIYDSIIIRAKNRILDSSAYYEKHHIVPRCLGGSDSPENLVHLTGREHYIAHQLLVKIHPNNHSLIKAATMMCCFSDFQHRSQNRLYEWLRIKLSMSMKAQVGEKNSQHNTVWMFNLALKQNKKIHKDLIEEYKNDGWELGRKTSWVQPCCKQCNQILPYSKRTRMFCSKACKASSFTSSLDGREQELISAYQRTGSLNKSLKEIGFPGAVGAWYNQAKRIIDNHQ